MAALSVDDPNLPRAFVALEGPVTIDEDLEQRLYWATVVDGRYMGEDLAEEFGKRNGVEGELVCRLTPAHLSGMSDMAG